MGFRQARWYTPTNGRRIRLLVVHAMQVAEKPSTAEGVAAMFERGERKASAHYCHDNNSDVQCVHDKDVAYAAPGANHDGLHFELAGFSEQSETEWLDPYSSDTIVRAGTLMAKKCKEYKIPPTFLGVAGVRDTGKFGITTHKVISDAFHKSDHWDPGPNFPMSFLLQIVKAGLNGNGSHPVEWFSERIPGTGFWPNGRAPFVSWNSNGDVKVHNNLPGNPVGWFAGDMNRRKDGSERHLAHAGPITGFYFRPLVGGQFDGYEMVSDTDGGVWKFPYD